MNALPLPNKKGPRYRGPLAFIPGSLDRNDILSLRAFLALRDGELDLLAFGERLEAAALNRAEVRKYVRARFLGDEAEALGFVEPFHGSRSCRHNFFLFNQSNTSPCPRAGVAGSDAITDEKQVEVLRKKLLMERRNGVHSEKRTFKLGASIG